MSWFDAIMANMSEFEYIDGFDLLKKGDDMITLFVGFDYEKTADTNLLEKYFYSKKSRFQFLHLGH